MIWLAQGRDIRVHHSELEMLLGCDIELSLNVIMLKIRLPWFVVKVEKLLNGFYVHQLRGK
jgi:hypothetical protein